MPRLTHMASLGRHEAKAKVPIELWNIKANGFIRWFGFLAWLYQQVRFLMRKLPWGATLQFTDTFGARIQEGILQTSA